MKLSIITINFNNRDGLQKTIDSVIAQTWRDFEWIIIDGGSTDGSRELIEKYQNHFAYWCSEPDKGVYNAMNKGVSYTRAEYVLFMNSGDCLNAPNTLETLISEGHTADIISGQVVDMDKGSLIRHYDENILIQLFCDTLNHQGTLISKKLLQKRFYDENFYIVSDWKFWLETILYDRASVQYSNTIVARQDSTGISSTNPDLIREERQQVLDEVIPRPIQKLLSDYRELRRTIVYRRVMFLKNHHPYLFALLRQMLAIMLLFVGVNNKKLLEFEKSNAKSFCNCCRI